MAVVVFTGVPGLLVLVRIVLGVVTTIVDATVVECWVNELPAMANCE
jgi:hypothetical protein